MADEPPTYFSPATDTAARILGMLSRYGTRASSLADIARALGASRTTCLRVLRTLESHGLVHHDEARRTYALGYMCAVLGSRAQENLDYLAHVRPLLVRAHTDTGLTAAFAQRISTHRMMYVAKESSRAATHVDVSVGHRYPITGASYGKWVVAFAEPAERAELLADGLPKVTVHTETDVDAYLRDVDGLVERGVLVSREEYVAGIVAVSCPVRAAGGELLGVLVVLGLSAVLDEPAIAAITETMAGIGEQARFDRVPA